MLMLIPSMITRKLASLGRATCRLQVALQRPGRARLTTAALALALAPPLSAIAGNLDPSGPPAPTMKALDVVEPRTPISSLPFTISTAGSYYLTRNLTFTGATAITVNAGPTTIDLNGYALDGGGTGATGIAASAQTVRVYNGTIKRFDKALDFVGGTQTLENLIVEGCKSGAIVGDATILKSLFLGTGATFSVGVYCPSNVAIVKDSRIARFSTGLLLFGPRSLVEACVIDSNLIGVAFAGFNSTIRHSNVVQNTDWGISVVASSVVSENNVSSNTSDGIFVAGDNVIVTKNNVTSNGNYGIVVQNGTRNVLVSENNVSNNAGDGIETKSIDSRIEGNTLNFNGRFGLSVFNTGNFIIRNSGRANSSANFSIAAGNIAPIEFGIITNVVSNVSY